MQTVDTTRETLHISSGFIVLAGAVLLWSIGHGNPGHSLLAELVQGTSGAVASGLAAGVIASGLGRMVVAASWTTANRLAGREKILDEFDQMLTVGGRRQLDLVAPEEFGTNELFREFVSSSSYYTASVFWLVSNDYNQYVELQLHQASASNSLRNQGTAFLILGGFCFLATVWHFATNPSGVPWSKWLTCGLAVASASFGTMTFVAYRAFLRRELKSLAYRFEVSRNSKSQPHPGRPKGDKDLKDPRI